MVDIAAISSALSGLKAATDIAKLLKESDVSLEKAEHKLKLAELVSVLADVKVELAEIQQLVIDKEGTIRKLQDDLKIKESLSYEQPYYWLVVGEKKEGPFCQQCYDNDHKLIRLQGYGNGHWDCKTCRVSYVDKTHVPEGPLFVSSRSNYDDFV